jgi:hypothetical protein
MALVSAATTDGQPLDALALEPEPAEADAAPPDDDPHADTAIANATAVDVSAPSRRAPVGTSMVYSLVDWSVDV